jgi:cell division protein FtsB
MIVWRELRRRARVLIGPIVGAALTGYFAYNLIVGDRGLSAWVEMTRRIHAENNKLANLDAEQAALGLKVKNLTPDHLDPDLLDERVRATLNLAAPDEIVIMPPPH